jgi:Tol biopolymer transport system component/C-terminal processing protease CtpA/Prc
MRTLALSPDGKQLAFVYHGDVWVAPVAGGKAEPITSNIEYDSNPVWSPDGKWLAFSSNRTGSTQTFYVPAEGGNPQRLTYYAGGEAPSDWTADGKSILTQVGREDQYNGFYLIDVNTTQPKQLMVDNAGIGFPSLSPDNKKIVFTRMGFPWWRARYQGSAAAQLWVVDIASGKRTELRNNGFQHQWPKFGVDSKTVYCVTVSDKTPSSSPLGKPIPKIVDTPERTPNVYAVDPSGKAKRITNFVVGGVRFLTSASKANLLAFEYEGEPYIMVPGQKPQKIEIVANDDDKSTIEERLILTNGASNFQLSPDLKTMAFVVRNEIWTVPVKKGKGPNANDATQLTKWVGVDDEPVWSPDGKSMFFTSDREGSQRLYKMDVATEKIEPISKVDYDIVNVNLTPDQAFLTYWQAGKEGGMFVVPVAGGEPKKIIDQPWTYGWRTEYSWSPDGRYVAYLKRVGSGPFNVWVTDVVENKSYKLTALNSEHSSPTWSPDGKYLYFNGNEQGDSLYVIPLQPEDARTVDTELKYEKPTGPVKVEIDFDDIANRVRKFSTQPCNGNVIADYVSGDIYYISNDGDIWKTSYNGETSQKVSANGNISGFSFTADNSGLVYNQGGNLFIMTMRPAAPAPKVASVIKIEAPKASAEDLDAQRRQRPGGPPAKAAVAPAAPVPPGVAQVQFRCDWTRNIMEEHKAAFYQFWRAFNRSFYDPNFHGRDWVALRKRYEPLLPSVAHRNEMAILLNMMCGELESSHSEVGSAPGGPPGQSQAHLGVTFDYSYAGPGLKIKEVPAHTPGSYAKTKLNPGEFIMSINGVDVSLNEALYRDVLIKAAGRDVTLLVNKTATKKDAREVKYRALNGGDFDNIRYQNRIEARRKYVEEKSGGKLAYIHIAGMGGNNFEQFNKEIWERLQGKQGVILDVRENGGGNISDSLIDIIERVPHSIYQDRDWVPVKAPSESIQVPIVVMCAESSYSNAEMFPMAMKARNLATIVGMPTPGYVIWTGGLDLVDGTSARMPGAGVYRLNGISLENNGMVPDVLVPWTREQYFAGVDPQLEKSVEILMKKVK